MLIFTKNNSINIKHKIYGKINLYSHCIGFKKFDLDKNIKILATKAEQKVEEVKIVEPRTNDLVISW